MRRRIGLYKEYDIVELTNDVPSANLLKGDRGTLVSICASRSGASFLIEFFGSSSDSSDESEDEPCRTLEVELMVQPPSKIVDTYFENQTHGDTYDVFPDDRRMISIHLESET